MPERSADAMLDAVALVRAAIDGDSEAGEVILAHTDLRAVAVQLALLAATGLRQGLGSSESVVGFLDWMQMNADSPGGEREQ